MACILLMDHDPLIRELFRQMLERAGYTVVQAHTEREGLHYCQTHPVDLVLTDLLCPHPRGFAGLRALRTLVPSVTIMVLSGWGAWGDGEVRALATQLDVHLSVCKPVGRQELLATIQTVLHAPADSRDAPAWAPHGLMECAPVAD